MRRFVLLPISLVACAGPGWRSAPHDVRFQEAPAPILHPRPAKRPGSSHWDGFRASVPYELGKPLRISRMLGSSEPLDVNDFGEVIDSPWFENRIGRRSMSVEELARGPDRLDGPAEGPLLVLSGKRAGITPGFVVKDQAGHRFVVKLDAPQYSGLGSGAEVIATKLLHAAGYHVPENYVVDLDVDRLVLSEDAKTAGRYGEEIPLDGAAFERLRSAAAPFPDRKARALFSRIIDGKIIGPFPFEGTTKDDPNDRVPHERRRSIRGMWVFAAWLDNVDARPTNTLDAFLPVEDGLGYVKHYWIDFGSSLGSSGGAPKPADYGREYAIDWAKIGRRALAFGLRRDPWEEVSPRVRYRCVGRFEAEGFVPDEWVPLNPVPPFDLASPLDTFWAASILARFTEAHLEAAVATARYPEAGAAPYVVEVLRARQLAILRHAFEKVLPLTDPVMNGDRLEMIDLEAEVGLIEDARYRHRVRIDRAGGGDRELLAGEAGRPVVDLGASLAAAHRAGDRPRFLTVAFERNGSPGRVEVHLRVLGTSAIPVGITRAQ